MFKRAAPQVNQSPALTDEPPDATGTLGTKLPNLEGNSALSLAQVRRVLNTSYDAEARHQAVQQVLPLFWSRLPWARYHAACTLTTRIYLPYAAVLEWRSFPCVFLRELRRRHRGLPPIAPEQRVIVGRTLSAMLRDVVDRVQKGLIISSDISADICEAIGRLGMYEAEGELLLLFRNCGGSSLYSTSEVRVAVKLALATLPPERLERFWEQLSHGPRGERHLLAEAIHYMTNPEAVPFLLQALRFQTGEFQESVALPIVRTLGNIGDLRALPVLQEIAREEGHPLRPAARKAIQRLMKEAQGLEEVTLVRASEPSASTPEALLRPVQDALPDPRPQELLRPRRPEDQTAPESTPGNTASPSAVQPDGSPETPRTASPADTGQEAS